MDYYQEALKNIPGYAWAINHPEIGPLIRSYLENREVDPTFTLARLRGELESSNWYKTTQASTREWQAFTQRDPETANAQRRQKEANIWDLYFSSGIQPTPGEVRELAEQALTQGWTDTQIRDMVTTRLKYTPGPMPVGDLGVTMQMLKEMANKWYVPISDEAAFNFAKQVFAGERKASDFEIGFKDTAKGRFPTLQQYIDKGISPDDFFQPYKQRISQLMEIHPDTINLLDTKWNSVIDTVEPKDGSHRVMTLNETDRYVRGLDEWKGTRQGQQAAADMAESLLSTFGKVA